MSRPITSFRGDYWFLSNFYTLPEPLVYHDVSASTVEHVFQAMKTSDPDQRAELATAGTPGEAECMGRKVSLREGWDEVKLGIMEDLLRIKFAHPELRQRLTLTEGAELIEGTTWHDMFWGVCFCNGHSGRGQNHLGRLLMKVRAS